MRYGEYNSAMAIQIIHHGGRNGVTGSCHELVLDPANSLLVDCGLFQGAETSADGAADAARPDIAFPVDHVRALVATHVHIDHVGRIPWLLAAGFKGQILCSEPSARLLPIVLADAFALGISRDRRLVERYLRLVESRLVALRYGQWHSVVDTPQLLCRIRLQPAGHILGSAFVECDVSRPAGRSRVVFSGDLGATYAPILAAPRSPWSADVVVLESTYGDRNHESRKTRRERLQRVIGRALSDGGTIVVPAFSIGRTQELLYELEDIIHRQSRTASRESERWATLPVYLDSPLAGRFTQEYERLQTFWDAEARARLRTGRRPLAFAQLVAIDDHAAHEANVRRLARSGQPAIVIAAGGMCTGGRVVNYLKSMLGDGRHDVLFVGYQARGTPGHSIQQHGPQGGYVDLDGERIAIRAGVHTVSGYSAHADRGGLARFITRMRHLPREVRLIHGDEAARKALADFLTEKTGGRVTVLR
jgi:metallo-beta-lactamase family protein